MDIYIAINSLWWWQWWWRWNDERDKRISPHSRCHIFGKFWDGLAVITWQVGEVPGSDYLHSRFIHPQILPLISHASAERALQISPFNTIHTLKSTTKTFTHLLIFMRWMISKFYSRHFCYSFISVKSKRIIWTAASTFYLFFLSRALNIDIIWRRWRHMAATRWGGYNIQVENRWCFEKRWCILGEQVVLIPRGWNWSKIFDGSLNCGNFMVDNLSKVPNIWPQMRNSEGESSLPTH